MSLPATRSWANIRRSIQAAIGNSVNINGVDFLIYHDWSFSDPDNMRMNDEKQQAWIETQFIEQLAGMRGNAILQLDCYSRVGEEGAAGADSFGFTVELLADGLEAIFTGVDANGDQRGYIRVKDYSNLLNPIDTNMFLLMQSPGGDIGVPQSRVRLSLDQDFRRVTITMMFRTIQDAAGQAAFYT